MPPIDRSSSSPIHGPTGAPPIADDAAPAPSEAPAAAPEGAPGAVRTPRAPSSGVSAAGIEARLRQAPLALAANGGFQALPPHLQERALEMAARDPSLLEGGHGYVGGALGRLLLSPGVGALDARRKESALEVLATMGPAGREQLCALAERRLPSAGGGLRPALLDPDAAGAPLIDDLHHLAVAPRRAGVPGPEMLASICEEAANPYEVEQSEHGTCATASMQYMLCAQNPGEYVRLLDQLTGPSGIAPMRQQGQALQLVADSVPPDGGARSPSERIFQAALMDYCNGVPGYSNVLDAKKLDYDIWPDGRKALAGNDASRKCRGLSALFGRPFQAEGDADRAIASMKRRTAAPTPDARQATVGVRFSSRGQPMSHAMVFERLDEKEGRVYFRNPAMWRGMQKGADVKNLEPATRVDDPARGIVSMSVADFKARFISLEQ